jgi:hypothetical protein
VEAGGAEEDDEEDGRMCWILICNDRAATIPRKIFTIACLRDDARVEASD